MAEQGVKYELLKFPQYDLSPLTQPVAMTLPTPAPRPTLSSPKRTIQNDPNTQSLRYSTDLASVVSVEARPNDSSSKPKRSSKKARPAPYEVPTSSTARPSNNLPIDAPRIDKNNCFRCNRTPGKGDMCSLCLEQKKEFTRRYLNEQYTLQPTENQEELASDLTSFASINDEDLQRFDNKFLILREQFQKIRQYIDKREELLTLQLYNAYGRHVSRCCTVQNDMKAVKHNPSFLVKNTILLQNAHNLLTIGEPQVIIPSEQGGMPQFPVIKSEHESENLTLFLNSKQKQ